MARMSMYLTSFPMHPYEFHTHYVHSFGVEDQSHGMVSGIDKAGAKSQQDWLLGCRDT